jgi:hypothetical protein
LQPGSNVSKSDQRSPQNVLSWARLSSSRELIGACSQATSTASTWARSGKDMRAAGLLQAMPSSIGPMPSRRPRARRRIIGRLDLRLWPGAALSYAARIRQQHRFELCGRDPRELPKIAVEVSLVVVAALNGDRGQAEPIWRFVALGLRS